MPNQFLAAHFEMENYEKAIEDCELAVEKGRHFGVDFKVIAR